MSTKPSNPVQTQGQTVLDRRPLALTMAWYGLALALVAVAIGPALWLVFISLQSPGSDLLSAQGIRRFFTHAYELLVGSFPRDAEGKPIDYQGATLQNYDAAWRDGKLARPMLNSVAITLVRAGLNVLVAALAAYPLARMRFRGRDALFVLLLCTLMIPEQVITVPMFRLVVAMGWYDTLIAVIVPFSVTAFGIYLCRQAFLSIPEELDEAARIDGANAWHTWRHVMLPLSAPTLSTLFLFSVIGAWSELLWPLVVLQSEHNMTLPVAINRLMGQFSTNTRLAYAAAVLALVPVITIFLLAQRFLKPEMFAGSVKG